VLFDLNPKEDISDIYGREKELALLSGSLKRRERLIVVYGLRRVGKTSLIRALLNKREFSYLFIDAKEIYFKHASIPIGAFSELIAGEFMEFTKKLGLDGDALETFSSGAGELTELLKGINRWCKSKGIFLAIALDEAQYLRYGGKVRYDGILAWCIDNLANISFVLTGSEVGMLKDFLRYSNADAPLYGRFRSEIYLDRFDKKKSEGFLAKGFREYGKKIDAVSLNDATQKVGGIVGWLTYYGYYRTVMGLSHNAAIDKVFDEGSRIMIKEIEGLISRSRKRYSYILKAVAGGENTWTEIKAYVSAKSGKISDTVLNSLLQHLVKLGIVEKDEKDVYSMVDPLLVFAVKRIKP
jgi:hypothetical protein